MAAPLPAQAHPDFSRLELSGLTSLALPAGQETHVWLSGLRPESELVLSSEELSRAARFRQQADRDRFGTGRSLLRRLLSLYLEMRPEDIGICGGVHQKPFLSGSEREPLHFNLTHSGDQVLIVIGRQPVGIDTEFVDPSFEWRSLLPEHFSPAEQEMLTAAPDPTGSFYRLWTRKEALMKAEGAGLDRALNTVPVTGDEAGSITEGERWQLLSFASNEGYESALACNVLVRNIVFYRAI